MTEPISLFVFPNVRCQAVVVEYIPNPFGEISAGCVFAKRCDRRARQTIGSHGRFRGASNEDMGNDYITELTPPTTEEIRNARPLATVLPHDVLTPAMPIAVTLCARTEDDRAVS